MDQQRIKLKRDPLSFSLKISLSLSLSLTLPFYPNLSLYTSSVYFSHSLCVHISLSSLCITDLKLISQSLSSFLSLFILSTSLFLSLFRFVPFTILWHLFWQRVSFFLPPSIFLPSSTSLPSSLSLLLSQPNRLNRPVYYSGKSGEKYVNEKESRWRGSSQEAGTTFYLTSGKSQFMKFPLKVVGSQGLQHEQPLELRSNRLGLGFEGPGQVLGSQ